MRTTGTSITLLCISIIVIVTVVSCAPSVTRLSEKGDVPGLIQAMEAEGDPEVRKEAARALGELGDERALAALMGSLGDAEVGGAAAEALVKIDGEQAVDLLIDALDEGDQRISTASAEILGTIGGEKAIAPLIELLVEAENADLRSAAGAALVRIGSTDGVSQPPGNIASVEDVIEALAELRSERAADVLIAVLESGELRGDSEIRQEAVRALSEVGGDKAVQALADVLENDDDEWLRLEAATALAAVDGERAVELLVEARSDDSEFVRLGAVEALAMIDDERAVEPLIALLGEGWAREAAAHALGQIGDDRAVAPLIRALEDGSPMAADALGEFGDDSEAVMALADALDHDSEPVRLSAAGALARLGDERGVPILIAALGNRESSVRSSGVAGLLALYADDANKLLPYLEDGETASVYYVLIEIGDTGSEDALVAALQRFGREEMAEHYYNSGNEALKEAARDWAGAHGYMIVPASAGSEGPPSETGGPTWGGG